MKKVVS